MSYKDEAAQLTEQFFTDIALLGRKPDGPQATGRCLCCGKPLANGVRWCDADCRDDWEKISQSTVRFL